MTDDRDQSWEQFAADGGEASDEAEPSPQTPNAEAARQQLLRRIDRRETVLDRTVKELDEVIDRLRGAAAARTSQESNRSDTTIPPASERSAAATVEVVQQPTTPPLKADNANSPETRSADAGHCPPVQEARNPEPRFEKPSVETKAEVKDKTSIPGMVVIDGDRGPIKAEPRSPDKGGSSGGGGGGGHGGGGGGGGVFHKRLGPVDFSAPLKAGLRAIKPNLMVVMLFTLATNVLVLAIPVYLFQISDRVLTSRSVDTLVMLTALIVGAVILQAIFDGIRRMILMRTAVEVAAQLGAPILSAAARASLHGNVRE